MMGNHQSSSFSYAVQILIAYQEQSAVIVTNTTLVTISQFYKEVEGEGIPLVPFTLQMSHLLQLNVAMYLQLSTQLGCIHDPKTVSDLF